MIEPTQQLVFTTSEGDIQMISLDELLGLLEDLPLGSTFANVDPFDIPMATVSNAPAPVPIAIGTGILLLEVFILN